ncbi:unnamed protein product (mitochondrion) [Plasmodiophora brassicae]|uniref:Uncharacterized protein n=1 Tax=Plasmodiophora brassicae TaxID=37360 RepID=A0A3P3YND1_PLABS|nr:unnamed protein product [Plasmodiophora brassicae]
MALTMAASDHVHQLDDVDTSAAAVTIAPCTAGTASRNVFNNPQPTSSSSSVAPNPQAPQDRIRMSDSMPLFYFWFRCWGDYKKHVAPERPAPQIPSSMVAKRPAPQIPSSTAAKRKRTDSGCPARKRQSRRRRRPS